MKKIIVAGNWKMNKSYLEAKKYIAILNSLEAFETEIILAVPALYSDTLYANNKKETVHIVLQNCSSKENGAFTGEISAQMIASLAMKYCIVGHSERRQYFYETNEEIALKVKQLLTHRIKPILCIGETLEERNADKTFQILNTQLHSCLDLVSTSDIQNIILAYEPVWAIGTGVTATQEQAQEVHLYIYNLLKDKYGETIANTIPILYGGSCNEKNAKELFSQPNIWGGLIGGASLEIDAFHTIIQIAEILNNNG